MKEKGAWANPELIRESRQKATAAGMADRIEFIPGDLFTNEVSPASVLVLYLGHGANLELRAKLVRSLRPGTRIVSHQFGMGEWAADKKLDVRTGSVSGFLKGGVGETGSAGYFEGAAVLDALRTGTVRGPGALACEW